MKSYCLKTLACAAALASMAPACAQSTVTPLAAVKPLTDTNPVNPLEFCADPTAVEYDGRLYVYTTYDQQEYDYTKGAEGNSYGHITTVLMMSTTDMVNWTYHGTADMKAVCGSWVPQAWAPSIISRVEDDGLTHFYMYFSIGGNGVGVVTSTSPVGPWKSPLKAPLVNHSTPGMTACCWVFDPGVVIDDNGTGWMAFGGGYPVDGGSMMLTKNPRIVRLGKDLVSLDSEIVPINAPYHYEANELNFIGGKFVYTYCSNWEWPRADWSQYTDNPKNANAPSMCSMDYLTSDNPLDPNGWTWGGEMVANPGVFGYAYANNHTHMHKYNGAYYLLYHARSLEKLMNEPGPDYRSLGVSRITVNESTVHVDATNMGGKGAPQIVANRPKAYERQQAETFWNAVGVKPVMYRAVGNTAISRIQSGGWVAVKSAVFGSTPMDAFTANIKGKGHLEVRLDRLESEPVAVIDFSTSKAEDITTQLTKAVTGTHDVYFVFDQTTMTTMFDEWQFSASEADAVQTVKVSEAEVVRREYFTLLGVRVARPQSGVYIQRSTYSDGKVKCIKVEL